MINNMKHDISIRILKVANVFLVTLFFALAWYGYYSAYSQVKYYRRGAWVIIAIFGILYFMFCRAYDGFSISIGKVSEIIYSQILAVIISNGIMFMFIWLVCRYFPNVLPLIYSILAEMCVCVIWVLIANKWYYWSFARRKTLVIYDCRSGLEETINSYGMDKKFEVLGSVISSDILDDLSTIDRYDTVFLSGVRSHDRNIILKYCVSKGVEAYVIPRIGDVLMESAKPMHMFHLPMLCVKRYRPVPEYVFFKRLFDIVISFVAMIIFSPFMLITAICVKADGGPALYKQKRLTKDGKEFYIIKFRSMRVDAEKDGVARLSTGSKDDRITKVGKVIRAIRFDELPQVFNILRGDMSIVGPRPERPEIAAQYAEELPEFGLRLQVKAGLTGYAQVYGKYNTTPYDKLLMDLMYIANPSFIEDIKICFATIKILFMKESTDGIEEGKVTAAGK